MSEKEILYDFDNKLVKVVFEENYVMSMTISFKIIKEMYSKIIIYEKASLSEESE